VGTLALLTYYFSAQPAADEAVRGQIRTDTLAAADAIVARTAANPYHVSLRSTDYVWGSNGHYLLGRNSFGLSWVTQTGRRPFHNPHHRPSGADANAEPWPGLLSGGPNRYGGDPVIDALPATPPARRYKDDQGSYASTRSRSTGTPPSCSCSRAYCQISSHGRSARRPGSETVIRKWALSARPAVFFMTTVQYFVLTGETSRQ
jgi:hypothetical protein